MTNSIFIFGNPDLPEDSLPIRIIPELAKKFPSIKFNLIDPNEEWDIPGHLIIIDTAFGIDEIKVFDDLDSFARSPRVSMHDFDALTNLRYLKKLGKVKGIRIIGIPNNIDVSKAVEGVVNILKEICA